VVSEDEEALRELFLAPSDPNSLDEVFKAFCKGASLNPDPTDEDEGDFFYNEAEVGGSNFEMKELEESINETGGYEDDNKDEVEMFQDADDVN